MRIKKIMIENRDTAGWGIVGTVSAFLTSSQIIYQMATAIAVAAAGTLASYVTRELVRYIHRRVKAWLETRKERKLLNN